MAVVVPILTEFDQRGLDRAQKELRGLGQTSKRSSLLMAAGFTGAGAALVGLGRALAGATEMALDDQKQQVLLARQLRESADATDQQVAAAERWVAATSSSAAVADDKLRPALGALVRATGDTRKAQDLLSLALDVSAGSGKSLESVTQALVRAQNGNVTALKKLGVPLDDTILKTKDFDRAQVALAATFDGAARTSANTLSGQMDKLKIQMGEAQESIGALLIPVLLRLMPLVVRAAELIAIWATRVGALVAVFRDQFGPQLALVGNAVAALVKLAKALIEGDWSETWEQFKRLASSAIAVAADVLRGAANLLGRLAVALGEAIVRGMIAGISKLAGALRDQLVNAVKDAYDAAKKFLQIGSPSRRYERLGENVTLGFARGLASVPMPTLTAPRIATAAGAGPASSINVTVNAGLGADGDAVGRAVVRALQQYSRANGAIPIRVTG